MSYFKVFKIEDYLYQFKDALGSLSTLLIGKDAALVLDTCYGIGDLYQEIRNITNLPLIVINSHGHMDHSCGNYQFDKVYIHSKDYKLVKEHNSPKWRINNINAARKINMLPIDFNIDEYINKREGNLEFLDDINSFSLGEYTIEILMASGHTHGSIALYCKELKLMIVSDAICQYVWLFLNESTTVTEYVKTIKNVLSYDFDNFIVGHTTGLLPKDKMIEYLNCAEDLIKGINSENIEKVSFTNFDDIDSYAYCTDKLYSSNGCGVVFDKNKL